MLAVLMFIPLNALAFNVVDLPESMTFADALSIFDADEIEQVSVSDLAGNTHRDLTNEEIKDFYYAAREVTVWRKINPTPFRGACVNFTSNSGARISYYFDAGIQIGMYGSDNYICYMPSRSDGVKLSYLLSRYYDSKEFVGGSVWNSCNNRDFLKLPETDWAKDSVKAAAALSLLPYEFTDKYGKLITREQMAVLMANFLTVTGEYPDMDTYLKGHGVIYLKGIFRDCVGRDDAIDQLYALGLINGRSDEEFAPDANVTRQEFTVFLTKLAEKYIYIQSNYTLSSADKGDIADWANFYVRWCLDKGIMSVDDNNRFNPNENISVEQAVTALVRLKTIVSD